MEGFSAISGRMVYCAGGRGIDGGGVGWKKGGRGEGRKEDVFSSSFFYRAITTITTTTTILLITVLPPFVSLLPSPPSSSSSFVRLLKIHSRYPVFLFFLVPCSAFFLFPLVLTYRKEESERESNDFARTANTTRERENDKTRNSAREK
jgi:hypothetical protein